MNDLIVSNIGQENVPNNNYALKAIQEDLNVNGLRIHNQLPFTTKMVTDFYGVDENSIKRSHNAKSSIGLRMLPYIDTKSYSGQ